MELYSNEYADKVFFMVKSFITFYLTQYHKHAFHDKIFLSVYFILKNGATFPRFGGKKSKLNLSLGLLRKCC